MKRIRYKYVYAEINHGTEANPDIEQAYVIKNIPYTEANEKIAKQEAHNGEIEIVEDGEAAAPVPTIEERLNELTEAVNLLLEGAQE